MVKVYNVNGVEKTMTPEEETAWEEQTQKDLQSAKERDEIRNNAREINNLKCEMHEIKDMLKKVLDKNGN